MSAFPKIRGSFSIAVPFVDPSVPEQQSENARPGQRVPLFPVPFCELGEYRAVQYRHQHRSLPPYTAAEGSS